MILHCNSKINIKALVRPFVVSQSGNNTEARWKSRQNTFWEHIQKMETNMDKCSNSVILIVLNPHTGWNIPKTIWIYHCFQRKYKSAVQSKCLLNNHYLPSAAAHYHHVSLFTLIHILFWQIWVSQQVKQLRTHSSANNNRNNYYYVFHFLCEDSFVFIEPHINNKFVGTLMW